jgi:lysine 2,3-aminomutase
MIPHLDMIRIHTRLPLADPEKITETLCESLSKLQKPLYLSLHINHAHELTPEVRQAITALDKAGCILLSQSVLLKGVNDNAETLESLFRALITLKVQPYYLHHPDLAPGTSHFRLSLSEGQALFKKLQGRVSGICLPTYMLDIPGGYGKVPVTADHIKPLEDGTYIVTDNEGREHAYPESAQTGGTV